MTDEKLSTDAAAWAYKQYIENDPERVARFDLVRERSPRELTWGSASSAVRWFMPLHRGNAGPWVELPTSPACVPETHTLDLSELVASAALLAVNFT